MYLEQVFTQILKMSMTAGISNSSGLNNIIFSSYHPICSIVRNAVPFPSKYRENIS